jgi:hypothetical protein
MPPSAHRQAARIKLQELQRQRDRLDEHYSAIERRAAGAATPLERLRALYDGLRAATFARKPLHPEVANLDALFLQGRVDEVPDDLLAAWTQRLQRELAQGRLRAELAHAFGRLLDEPAPAPAPEAPPDPVFLRADTLPEPDRFTPAFLDELFGLFDARTLEGIRRSVRDFADNQASAAATDDEVKLLLLLLKREPSGPAEMRRQAAAALDSPTQVHEYAGVLTILLANLAEWDWPREGLPRRVVLLRDRPRLFLDQDLVSALLLQLIGVRWGMHLKGVRKSLLSMDVSAAETEQEGQSVGVPYARATRRLALFLAMIPYTLHDWRTTGGYGGNALEDQLRLLQADIRLFRTAFPDRPLHVVRTDLRDFYPRLSHALLLNVLERFGGPAVWRDFLARYLRVRVQTAEGPRVVERGVPLDHRIGDVLADWLLLLLDLFVQRQADVPLLRLVDDIYFVSNDAEKARAAWQAIQRFCSGCGLETNKEKSGAVTIGGPVPDGLPAGPLTWCLLELHPDGAWRLNEPALDRLHGWARRQVRLGGTTLRMVRQYNECLRFLCASLGLGVELGLEHLEAVGRRLAHLQRNLFAPKHGIVDELQDRLRTCFRDERLQQRGLPEALLYWPVTAGGLGLLQPLLLVAAHEKGRPLRPEPPSHPPAGSEGWLQASAWTTFYVNGLVVPVEPAEPATTPMLKTLLQDFIARGGEVAGRKQTRLRPYWQWIVTTYGPPLLEAVGTFRFLLTELVPLGLVFAESGSDDSEEDEDIPF